MSSVFLLLLLLLLAVCCVADVPVPYDLCSSSTAHLKINSVTDNEWPPVKGDTLNITVSGVVDEDVTSGEYTIAIKLDGFPLPDINGDIADFHPLPWSKGPLQFSFPEAIPSSAPGGTYNIEISAVDQNKAQLFCVSINFKLSLSSENGLNEAVTMIQNRLNHHRQNQVPMNDHPVPIPAAQLGGQAKPLRTKMTKRHNHN